MWPQSSSLSLKIVRKKIIYVLARKWKEDILTIDGYNSKMKFGKLISDMWRENTSRKLSL